MICSSVTQQHMYAHTDVTSETCAHAWTYSGIYVHTHIHRITDAHACVFVLCVSAGVKILNMSLSLPCTLTLKLRITRGMIHMYVCVSVYPLIPSSYSLSLYFSCLYLISNFHCTQTQHKHWHECSLMVLCCLLVWARQMNGHLRSNVYTTNTVIILVTCYYCQLTAACLLQNSILQRNQDPPFISVLG